MIALWLSACVERVDRPSSRIDCDLDFSDHPRAEALQAALDRQAAQGLPGLAMAVETEDGPWVGAAGWANIEDRVPLTVCHAHPLASIGKTWTAALALRLRDQGRLDIDDRVADHLPASVLEGIPNAERITLRQLMNHTSGIPDFNTSVRYMAAEFDDPHRRDSPEDLLDWVRGGPALGEPGKVYVYTDANYILLALVLDRVTGDRLAAMRSEIFEPLGLERTWLYGRGVPLPDAVVNSYWEVGADRIENVSDLQTEYGRQVIGADGILASPLDALAFVEAVVRGDLLSEASRAEMQAFSAPSLAEDPQGGYGLGLARHPDRDGMLGHTGGDVGSGAVIDADPDGVLAIAGATNVGMFLGGPLGEVWGGTWDEIRAALEP